MTKAQEEIKTHREYLELSVEQSVDALETLDKLCIRKELESNDSLKNMRASLIELREKSDKEIIQIQKNCKHEMYYSGHSHNDDCYECVICGHTEWS